MPGKRQSDKEILVTAKRIMKYIVSVDPETGLLYSVYKACEMAGVDVTTFRRWVADNRADIAIHYTGAHALRYDLMAEDILTIADTATDPYKAKNQIDARKWLMARALPRKYGDRMQIDADIKTNHKLIIAPPDGSPIIGVAGDEQGVQLARDPSFLRPDQIEDLSQQGKEIQDIDHEEIED